MTVKPDQMHNMIVSERSRLMAGFQFFVYDDLPKPEQLTWCTGAWKVGSGAATNRKEKIRFLKASELLTREPLPMTYTDANFAYLRFHARSYPAMRNRLTNRQIEQFNQYRSTTPAFAIPFHGDAIYFDLKAFHANVLLAFGRDMDYMPNEYIEPFPNHEDYPYWHNKEARNRLHSSAYGGGSILQVTGDETRELDLPSHWANPALIAFTTDLSSAIAHKMVAAGAVYANRDGYVVPVQRIASAFDTLDTIGLPYAIKEWGRCHVRHFGDYDIQPSVFGGGHTSKRKGSSFSSHPLRPIDADRLLTLAHPIILANKSRLLYPTYTDEQQVAIEGLKP